MKKEYVKPSMVCEMFAADEYVAACGDVNEVYKFKCDAPGGVLYYYPQSDDMIDGHYNGNGKAKYLGFTYHPCNDTHEASSRDVFYDGFVDRNLNGRCNPGEEVIVWRGKNGNNGHATAELNMSSWETAKS